MATQQAYQSYAQNKGTLVPGQSISVNKYNVQVERYLSQGGFAHVYLVRTAVPVYNTTHHVLKRIAVTNDGMLTDVKKEVDIMRILKGHPNIVHLIDAAWHKMPNGQYEVFILMEFCQGGGIIDMMNRRLRERLTEAEILQIFVDVCEGVAAMHNMRPALLHRDLKVENILQSTPNSFKLCDFGSATPVAPRPPATTQEIRALEADLNRHTTLQYRAPEMVDPFLRRPVDDKSDVWALGVLLYKLCYYTTPFEEHGPLAILNVQYRTPPYPVYSAEMNSLIGSMLREHGAQRPSVFELLSIVHRLRGTKSQFQYNIPTPQPLSPRHIQPPSQFPPQVKHHQPPLSSPKQPHKNINAGVQAREKVLDAISPMRRGRPTLSKEPVSTSRSSSPQKQKEPLQANKLPNWLDDDFDVEEEKAWKVITSAKNEDWAAGRGHKDVTRDAWNVGGIEKERAGTKKHLDGFDNDFAEKFGDSFDTTTHANASKSTSTRSPLSAGTNSSRSTTTSSGKPAPLLGRSKDAFEGLGLGAGERISPPTLGEARKLRTGLAVVNTQNGHKFSTNSGTSSNSSASRPTPSPQPSYVKSLSTHTPQSQSIPIPHSRSRSPVPPPDSAAPSVGSSWRPPVQLPRPSSSVPLDGLPVETRFPSLEELDASFGLGHRGSVRPDLYTSSQPQAPALTSRTKISGSETGGLRPIAHSQGSYNHDGVRSEQVTGVAMRAEVQSKRIPVQPAEGKRAETPSRPTLARKHRSTVSIKQTSRPNANDIPTSNLLAPPAAASNSMGREPEDWLTGDNDATLLGPGAISVTTSSGNPILRDSPSKRASFIEKSSVFVHDEVVATLHEDISSSPTRSHFSPSPSFPSSKTTITPVSSRTFPRAAAQSQPLEGLTDNWNSVATTSKETDREKDLSSSADEGPEDVAGYTPPGSKFTRKTRQTETKGKRGKGRQSSVHDLAGLWGGGLGSGAEAEKEPVRSAGAVLSHNSQVGNHVDANAKTQRQSIKVPSVSSEIPRSASPQAMLSPPTDVQHTSRYPKRPTPNSENRKQSSIAKPAGHSRPQSMFVFPVSKATSESTMLPPGKLLTGGPSSSEEPKLRAHTRRTSISDMVQHYEAIGGKTKTLRAPTIVSKHASAKVATHVTDVGRFTRAHIPTSSTGHVTGSSPPISDGTSGDPKKHYAYPNGFSRASPKPFARISPTELPRTALVGYRETAERALEVQSTRPASDEPSSSEPPIDFTFPTRMSSTLTNEPAKPSDERPPSPERPFQGVGKLIDQWQRKTAETDISRNLGGGNRRGGFTTKRRGVVSRETSRGQ